MGTGRREVYYMKEQCPKCGNWVEGKKVATFARKMTRGAVKKGQEPIEASCRPSKDDS